MEAGSAERVAWFFPAMNQNVMHWTGASERLVVFKEWLLRNVQ